MRKIQILLVVFGLFFSAIAYAEDVTEGIDYEVIQPAQPVNDPDKIEVVEVFWYGCPHCYRFEPVMGPWMKQLPKDVDFYRLPAVLGEHWDIHARAYFTAEILDVVDSSHDALFHKMHVDNKRMNSIEQLAEFYSAYGIEEKLFKKTMNSFIVKTKIARSKEMVERYGVQGVPALVIAGKYLVTGPMAKTYENMLKITDYLIEKERAAR